ncbi:MAG TPA: insulinase family protein [Longimicrobiaceae bacterium]|nr:insulinase family protein [Longimicrobiaceae bacterium]
MPDARLLATVLVAAGLGGCALLPLTGAAGTVAFQPIEDPAVRAGVLANGFTYYIRANAEPPNRAELRLVVNAGSVLEDDDQRGLAHMVEHMAFNGTRNFASDEIVHYLESVGMRFGPDVNAYTSFDETVYMLTLPTDSVGVLETGMAILEDWAWGIAFDSVQVERERQVVMEEWRLGRGAGSRVQQTQFPTLAARSRYAERLPIGTPESLRTFTHDALKRFYADWYRPDLMAVVAVGDFDVEEMEALIRVHFGRIPEAESPRRRREFPIPGHRETLLSVATDPELTSTVVSVYLKRRPEPWRTRREYRRWIVGSLASAMLVNRINEYTQRPDSPILDVSSFQGRFVRTLSTLALSARIPNARTVAGLGTLLTELERAAQHGFTATELEREQREMMRIMEQRFAEREKTTSASFAADYVSHHLYGGTVLDSDTEYQLYRELIADVRLAETNRHVRDWTGAADRVILVSMPEDRATRPPSDQELMRAVQSVARTRVRPYTDLVSEAPLVRTPPVPGAVVAEREIPGIGVQVWELGNGATIYLKPTDFREDEVLFAARSPGGTSLVPDEDYIPALTAAAVVQSGGLGELSANDLRKRLAGTLAGVGADIGETHEGMSGAASPRDLETLFQLVYLKFTAPRPDSVAFLAYQSQARSSLANRSASPDIAFQDSIRVALTQNHPRARPPSAAMFDQLDMERSFEIFAERFADASDFTFYLVGTFTPEEVRPHIERYLASLPALGRTETPRDVRIRPPTGVVRKLVRRGLEPRAATQLVFTGPFEFERENIIALQALADVLRIRLRETLREGLGGTYGVSVRGAGSRDPVPQYQFAIGFGTDPARLVEMEAALFAEIEALKTRGPTDEEVAKVRETQFRARETDIRQNHFWLTQLLSYNQYGWNLAQIPATATRAATITRESVQAAAQQYLDTGNYVQVSLLPEIEAAIGDSTGVELPG